MKNNSWKYPFETFSDKMFDGNNDGKLDITETSFRDAHLDEMNNSLNNNHNSKAQSNTSFDSLGCVMLIVFVFYIIFRCLD